MDNTDETARLIVFRPAADPRAAGYLPASWNGQTVERPDRGMVFVFGMPTNPGYAVPTDRYETINGERAQVYEVIAELPRRDA